MLSSSWSPTKFNLSILFVCCSCILAACLTRSGVSAQDKGDENCSTNNEVRLVDLAAQIDCNLDYFIGRVELCNGSVWKRTVCDDQWTTEDAMVVCRESGNIAEGAAALNIIDQVPIERDIARVVPQCEGSESNVSQCTIKTSSVSCSQSNITRIAAVACPLSNNTPAFNLSSCNPSIQVVTDSAVDTTSKASQSTNSLTTKQVTTASTPSNVDTSPSSIDSSTDTVGRTTSEGATSAPSNGLNLTIIYAAAGAAGGVIVLIIIVAILLVVIAARRRKISPNSPARSRKQSNTNDTNEIGTCSSNLNNTDISSGSATKHTIELDQPIYEVLKDSNVEGSPSTSLKSGTDTTVPVYAQLEGNQQYAQIQPCLNTLPRDVPKPTDSHYHSLNHNMSLTRNTSSSYQPQFVNKTAMAIEAGLATEADVRSPDSTHSHNSSPEHFKCALELESHQPTLEPSVNHSIEDLGSQVSTSAVVNQKVVPESGSSHLYAVLEAPHGHSPQLPPRMSNSLPRSAPANKDNDNRSNSMSRLKSNRSPKSLRSAANNSSPRPPKNKMSGSHGSPKFNRGMHSPYTQRGSLNTSRSSGLSSNTSGSGSTEGSVNSYHGDDGPRMNTLV